MKSRLTVVEQVCLQIPDEPPMSLSESRYVRLLATDEQLYARTMKVGEAWIPLDCGWNAKSAGLLVLINEPTRFTVQPTPEERAKADARVIEVALAGEEAGMWSALPKCFSVIRPGESCRFEPTCPDALRVRCRSGATRLVGNLAPC